jgi:hypothetical protein
MKSQAGLVLLVGREKGRKGDVTLKKREEKGTLPFV